MFDVDLIQQACVFVCEIDRMKIITQAKQMQTFGQHRIEIAITQLAQTLICININTQCNLKWNQENNIT